MSRPEPIAVANRRVECCRTQQQGAPLAELCAPGVDSVEAMPVPGQASGEIRGVEALRQRHAWRNDALGVRGGSVDGPYPHGGDRFAVVFEIDATNRETGERSRMKEVAVYHVNGGKIVREEFFYG